jgi:hypothetical protein
MGFSLCLSLSLSLSLFVSFSPGAIIYLTRGCILRATGKKGRDVIRHQETYHISFYCRRKTKEERSLRVFSASSLEILCLCHH